MVSGLFGSWLLFAAAFSDSPCASLARLAKSWASFFSDFASLFASCANWFAALACSSFFSDFFFISSLVWAVFSSACANSSAACCACCANSLAASLIWSSPWFPSSDVKVSSAACFSGSLSFLSSVLDANSFASVARSLSSFERASFCKACAVFGIASWATSREFLATSAISLATCSLSILSSCLAVRANSSAASKTCSAISFCCSSPFTISSCAGLLALSNSSNCFATSRACFSNSLALSLASSFFWAACLALDCAFFCVSGFSNSLACFSVKFARSRLCSVSSFWASVSWFANANSSLICSACSIAFLASSSFFCLSSSAFCAWRIASLASFWATWFSGWREASWAVFWAFFFLNASSCCAFSTTAFASAASFLALSAFWFSSFSTSFFSASVSRASSRFTFACSALFFASSGVRLARLLIFSLASLRTSWALFRAWANSLASFFNACAVFAGFAVSFACFATSSTFSLACFIFSKVLSGSRSSLFSTACFTWFLARFSDSFAICSSFLASSFFFLASSGSLDSSFLANSISSFFASSRSSIASSMVSFDISESSSFIGWFFFNSFSSSASSASGGSFASSPSFSAWANCFSISSLIPSSSSIFLSSSLVSEVSFFRLTFSKWSAIKSRVSANFCWVSMVDSSASFWSAIVFAWRASDRFSWTDFFLVCTSAAASSASRAISLPSLSTKFWTPASCLKAMVNESISWLRTRCLSCKEIDSFLFSANSCSSLFLISSASFCLVRVCFDNALASSAKVGASSFIVFLACVASGFKRRRTFSNSAIISSPCLSITENWLSGRLTRFFNSFEISFTNDFVLSALRISTASLGRFASLRKLDVGSQKDTAIAHCLALSPVAFAPWMDRFSKLVKYTACLADWRTIWYISSTRKESEINRQISDRFSTCSGFSTDGSFKFCLSSRRALEAWPASLTKPEFGSFLECSTSERMLSASIFNKISRLNWSLNDFSISAFCSRVFQSVASFLRLPHVYPKLKNKFFRSCAKLWFTWLERFLSVSL